MANMVGIWAARKAMAGWNIREEGLTSKGLRYTVYATHQVHTWLHKTADLLGIGIQAIRWIDTSEEQVMDAGKLEQQIRKDRSQGCTPLAVVATAGSVGLGVVDPLQAIASVCKRQKIWFHVDGAYGALAAALPELRKCFAGLEEADSIAVDPHKWLYCPLEAGCTLVKNENSLLDAFCFHPEYYQFDKTGDETPINYYQFGPQNSRGFRALKVWMVLQQAGAEGIRTAIREDISYSRQLYEELGRYPNLEAFTENLSICTFRYVPDVLPTTGKEEYLNRLNMELVLRLQKGGELFVSNAVLNGNYLLRTCIVNFRTSLNDIRAIPDIVIRYGKEIEKELRKP
jgi:glutamate/tyrosine decarboxylase-like PLP-dependent enzyme